MRPVRILVVDDEEGMAKLLGRTLRRLGHDTVVTLHPHDAIEHLGEGFDAVITDIDMPDMDGVALARIIRNRDAHMPIAFCTGSSPGNALVQEAAQFGTVLPKIWTLDEVMIAVERLRKQRYPH